MLSHRKVETLLVHCYGGESRSRAVAAFILKMFNIDNTKYLTTGRPNDYIYEVMEKAWEKRQELNN